MIRLGVNLAELQPLGHTLCITLRQGVNNATAGKDGDRLCQLGHSRGRIGHGDILQL